MIFMNIYTFRISWLVDNAASFDCSSSSLCGYSSIIETFLESWSVEVGDEDCEVEGCLFWYGTMDFGTISKMSSSVIRCMLS